MKLVGYLDGIEVKFDFYPPNQFKAEIPKKSNGTYIVEFKVIDDAGNETNYSNILIAINFNKMSFEILEGFTEKEKSSDYNSEELIQEYSYRELVI